MIDILTDFNDQKQFNNKRRRLKEIKRFIKRSRFSKVCKIETMSQKLKTDRKEAEEVVTELKPETIKSPEIKTEADELE